MNKRGPTFEVFPGALNTVEEQYFLLDHLVPWMIDVLPELEPRYG